MAIKNKQTKKNNLFPNTVPSKRQPSKGIKSVSLQAKVRSIPVLQSLALLLSRIHSARGTKINGSSCYQQQHLLKMCSTRAL